MTSGVALRIALFLALIGLALAAEPLRSLRKRIDSRKTISRRELASRDVDPSTLYPEYNLSVPIDHFHNDSLYEPHSDGTFNLRYWFDASNYAAGGPVIVLQSGETSAEGRLGFLQKGLIQQIAKETHGIAVVLEHRYYGTSFPTPDLSTENLRFLTTDQALADQAYFSQHVVFEGLEDKNLTSDYAAHIGYGGSYAGAFNALLRKLYPDVYWGAISSSGVVEAIYDYWQYFEPIRVYGEPTCISNQQKLTSIIDSVLTAKDNATIQALKNAFGLGNLTYATDFASVLSYGITGWQGKNWDPALNDPTFDLYCGNLTADSILYPSAPNVENYVQDLISKSAYADDATNLTTSLLNYIGYVNLTAVSICEKTQDGCFTNYNTTYYEQDDLSADWRSWPYQYCTQWGYLQTGSGVPKGELPLVSRTLDLEYNSVICVDAFNITTPPNTDAINKYGGFNISYPRLAFVDGEQDPWRPATPHASPFIPGVKNRTSTASEPFILIPGAVHHWDENGLFANETTATNPPPDVVNTQQLELQFVLEWMQEWQLKQMELRK